MKIKHISICTVVVLALGFAATLGSRTIFAADGTWTATAAGPFNWSDTTRWSGGTVADGTDFTAFFTANITAGQTVTVDSARTIGNITFTDSTSSHNLTITGTGANILTLDRTGVGVSSPLIDVTQAARTLQINAQISGNDGFTKTGPGTLILNNSSNNYTGKTVVTGGVLQIGTAFNAGELSVPGGYTSNPVTGSNIELNGGILSYWFDFNRSLGTGNGQIQLTGGVSGFTQKQGDRTNLTFGSAATTVVWGSAAFNPSVLVLNDDAAGPANTITFANLLNLNGADRTIATNSATRGAIMNNVISNSTGTSGLTKTGVGNLSLNASNTYNGATLISGGTLTIGNGGTTGALSISSTITTNATLAFNRTNTLTQGTNFANGIDGTGGITQAGTGTTIISGTNTYAGNTRGNAGILLATVATALPGYNSAGKVIFNGGTIGARIGGADWTTAEVDTLLSNATKTSGALGIDTTNGNLSQWTAFVGGGNFGPLGLTKIGSNVLTNDQANTYTGATRVAGGTLKAGVASVANVSGAFGVNSAVSLDNVAGVTLDLNGFNTQIGSLAGGGTTGGGITLNGATLTTGGNNTTTSYAGVISGSGNLIKIGTGVQTLTAAQTYLGTTTVDNGILDFAAGALSFGGGSGRNITVAAGAAVRRNALDNAFLQRLVETTDEIGVMTGTTANNLDFLNTGTGANLPNAFLGNWAGNGAKAEYSGTLTPASDNYRLGAKGSSGLLGIVGTNKLTGTQGLLVGGTGASGIRVNLAGSHNFTGQTVINTGARLSIGNNLALQNSPLNVGATGGNFSLAAGTNSGRITGETASPSPTFGGLIGSRNLIAVFSNAASNNETNLAASAVTGFTLNVGTGNTFTYSGAIGGFGSGASGVNGGNSTLTKTGDGTQILSGASTYTGATTVDAGTLLINGSLAAASAVSVNNAAILGGTGLIGGTVTVNGTATLSPGASIESLASGALTMGTATTFLFQAVDASATGADLMVVTGALSLTDVNLDLNGADLDANTWAVGNKLTLISYTGSAITSGFVGYVDDTSYSFGLNQWTINYNDTTKGNNFAGDAPANGAANFVTLELVAIVPEPSSLAMLAFGMISLWLFRKRKS